MESTLVHIVFFLKNGGDFKRTFRTLLQDLQDFLHSWTYNTHKKLYNGKYNKYLKSLPNLYYIESEAFSDHN